MWQKYYNNKRSNIPVAPQDLDMRRYIHQKLNIRVGEVKVFVEGWFLFLTILKIIHIYCKSKIAYIQV